MNIHKELERVFKMAEKPESEINGVVRQGEEVVYVGPWTIELCRFYNCICWLPKEPITLEIWKDGMRIQSWNGQMPIDDWHRENLR